MRKYFYIAAGGMVGAILRFAIKDLSYNTAPGKIPWSTLFINITGTFLLALILTAVAEGFRLDADIRLGIGTGFLGAYTSFSTLCKEVSLLFLQENLFLAASSLVLFALFGLTAAYFGSIIAKRYFSKNPKNRIIPKDRPTSDDRRAG